MDSSVWIFVIVFVWLLLREKARQNDKPKVAGWKIEFLFIFPWVLFAIAILWVCFVKTIPPKTETVLSPSASKARRSGTPCLKMNEGNPRLKVKAQYVRHGVPGLLV
jgi:hypothetical protein